MFCFSLKKLKNKSKTFWKPIEVIEESENKIITATPIKTESEMQPQNISLHITYGEATKSQTASRLAIDNTPNSIQLENMKLVAITVFESLRNWHGKPIGISSFFRSSELNKAIGGSSTSQHCNGEAIDIDADIFNNGITNAGIFNYIKTNLIYDQLIWEFGNETNPDWVHVSFKKENNRLQILKAISENGKTKYTTL